MWCGDGPAAAFGQPIERWIHGAAWNTPATAEEVNRLRSRHLFGASRGVGIRLVRDPTAAPATWAIVPVREILVAVLRRDGRAFALAHNHPDGNPNPSKSDVESTLRLHAVATALGVAFLDHIVVTDRSWRRVPMPDDEPRLTSRFGLPSRPAAAGKCLP